MATGITTVGAAFPQQYAYSAGVLPNPTQLVAQQTFVAQTGIPTPIVAAPSVPIGATTPSGVTPVLATSTIIGQPLVGGYGGVANTNQFIQGGYGYNQGFCGGCPWWVWPLVVLVLLGGLVAGLISAFQGNEDNDERKVKRSRKHRTKEVVR